MKWNKKYKTEQDDVKILMFVYEVMYANQRCLKSGHLAGIRPLKVRVGKGMDDAPGLTAPSSSLRSTVNA